MRFSRKNLTLAAGLSVIAASVVIFLRVFGLASESGTVFAPYSTFRADPLGMMALYNAADALPDTDALQFMQDFESLPESANTTFIIAGAGLGMDPVPVLESLEGFVSGGGRAVVAFAPLEYEYMLDALRETMSDRRAPASDSDDENNETIGDAGDDVEAGDENAEDDEAGESLDFSEPMEDVSERWGFDYGFEEPGDSRTFVRLNDTLPVEESIASRSGLYLIPEDEAWNPVLGLDRDSGGDRALGVMERSFGAGTIVICSDAYFLSNEALRNDRASGLIAWVLGPNPTIYFSETHLGTQQQERIMTLVRRYRLHGVLFGLVLVAVLFIWRHSATLIPRSDGIRQVAPATLAERSHQDGLDNLLVRFIPQSELLDTCMKEWSHQFHNNPKAPALERLHASYTDETGRPRSPAALVAAFNEIAREMQRK